MVLQKYCASGNDFLIFHAFKGEKIGARWLKSYAIEDTGFGADGLIVLLPDVLKRPILSGSFTTPTGVTPLCVETALGRRRCMRLIISRCRKA